MRRSGFTTIEMVIVVLIIGVIATLGFPRLRDSVQKQNYRSAKAALATYVAIARGTAVARGCRTALHFVSGLSSRVWVTSCKINSNVGRDTIGSVEFLGDRFNLRLQAGKDSIQFDSRGIRLSFERTVIKIRTKADQDRDSVVINQLGKVVSQ